MMGVMMIYHDDQLTIYNLRFIIPWRQDAIKCPGSHGGCFCVQRTYFLAELGLGAAQAGTEQSLLPAARFQPR